MKLIIRYAWILMVVAGCENLLTMNEILPTQKEVFEYYWEDFDEHYVGFDQRKINWDSVYRSSMDRIDSGLTQPQFFELMNSITLSFEDIHVSLRANEEDVRFIPDTDGQRKVKEMDRSITKLNSLGSVLEYTFIANNYAYLKVPSFNNRFDVSQYEIIDQIIPEFNTMTQGLIIDLRLNGGGEYKNGKALASRFIDHKSLYARHLKRSGNDHHEFEEYLADFLIPHGGEPYLKPIVLLTNRLTGSAAELFVQALRCRGQVFVVGEPTSGGLGINNWRELPNGWNYRITMTLVRDCEGVSHEGPGIQPDQYEVISHFDSASNLDRQFRAAVELLQQEF